MGKDNILTEVTIASVLFLILLLITLYTPFGLLTIFVLAGPFIFIAYKNENKIIVVAFLINLLLSFVIGSIVAAFLALLAASTGITMGKLYKRTSLLATIFIGALIVIINIILVLVLSNFLLDVNISDVFDQMLQESINSSANILNQLGDEIQTEQLLKQYNEFLEIASLLIPLMFIAFATSYVILNHFTTSLVLNKLGYQIPKFPPLRDWIFPRSIIYYYFFAAILYIINPQNYYLKVITLNLFPLLTIILLIQGLSFIFFYSYYKKFGKVLSIFAVIAIFIPFLNQVIQMLGIIDLGFNIRQRIKRN